MTLENYKYRTNPMFLRNKFDGDKEYGIPIIPKTELSEDDINDLRLFPFNAIKADNGKHSARIIHFFLYDYNFEKIWIDPDKYVDLLSKYKGVLTPDFSMYLEMPYALQIYNTFRNRWCGAYLADKGIRVIPTVSWSDEKSFEFCFKGIEKGSIVAVSTYMFHEHNNHADQKELFMKCYNKMLETVEPSKIICYSEPFDEMTGDIIYIDYDLSSWQHYCDDVGKTFVINKTIMNTSDKKIAILITKTGYITKGGGSAYGGDWIPKKESDQRFIGKPGEIKTTYYGYRRDTKIGDNGLAVYERHYSTAPNEKYHTNPHDHEITWENNHPNLGPAINYPDGNAPEFKDYIPDNSKRSIIKMEEKYESITDMKQSIMWGREVTFRIRSGIEYGIFRLNDEDIILAVSDGYKEKAAFENGSDEVHFKNVDDLLEYKLNGIPLKQVLFEAEITSRNL